jgi:tRNA(Arg) A34 adenosine deaminase TadA
MRHSLALLCSSLIILLILTAVNRPGGALVSKDPAALRPPEDYMKIAIQAADAAGNPFGSVIVNGNGEYVAAGNSVRKDGPTAHAEMNAIWKLKELDYDDPSELTLYTSAEPCSMCMSAIIWAGIPKVVFGMPIEGISRYYNQIQLSAKEVAEKSWYEIEINGPLMEKECTVLFEKFN